MPPDSRPISPPKVLPAIARVRVGGNAEVIPGMSDDNEHCPRKTTLLSIGMCIAPASARTMFSISVAMESACRYFCDAFVKRLADFWPVFFSKMAAGVENPIVVEPECLPGVTAADSRDWFEMRFRPQKLRHAHVFRVQRALVRRIRRHRRNDP